MDDTLIEDVVAKLSDTQRRAIVSSRMNRVGHLLLPSYRDAGKMRRSIEELRLCNASGRLNRLGTQVQAALRAQAGEK